MRVSNILALGSAALVSAAPLQERADLGEFSITNFVFGCTVTCDWSFDVTIGPKFDHHPAVKKAVHCSGTKDIKSFQDGTCTDISGTQTLRAFIGPADRLKLQYEIQYPQEGATYWYQGGKKVGSQTGNNPSPASFTVPELKASAIA